MSGSDVVGVEVGGEPRTKVDKGSGGYCCARGFCVTFSEERASELEGVVV